MKRTLDIGPSFKLPAADTQTQTLIVYGGKGMGKTNAAAVLAEELAAAHLKFAALDPMGVLYGLKHAADPAGPGLDVLVLGGRYGDIPIEPTAGAVVADLVVNEDISTIIDVSRRPNGTMWSVGERIRFTADYVSRLYERQGERMRPLMQIIDEAGRFVPQLIPHGSPEIARCVGAIERLVEEGRNVGVGVCLITQRSARMNKSVSELAECMIAFRTVGPRSIDAIVDWFGEHVPKERWKQLVERLRALPRGTALVVSPGWLQFEGEVAVRQRWTMDTSSTPTASGRRKTLMVRSLPPEQLAKYRERMADTIARVQADDPKALRARIAELERQVTPPAPKTHIEVVEQKVEVPVFDTETRNTMKMMLANLTQLAERIDAGVLSARGLVDALPKRYGRDAEKQQGRDAAKRVGYTEALDPYRRACSETALGPKARVAPVRSEATVTLKKGARSMLMALASMYPRALTRTQMATLAGLAPGSGTYASYLSTLRTTGMIDEDPGGEGIMLTDAGRAHVAAGGGPPATPRSTEDLVALWSSKLKAGARRMLDVLVAVYPTTLVRDELAQRSEIAANSGTFASYLSTLRSNGLVENVDYGLRASEGLFLGGRR